MIRLRQIAFAASDIDRAEMELSQTLSLELCFRDPGLITFGLRNSLFPVGDQFLEIVSPVQSGTTAGRFLERRGGDCGYMVLFQTDDLVAVEARLAANHVRVIHEAVTDGVRGLHLHPKDIGGAIVSIDQTDVASEWPWAGHEWRERRRTGTVTAITGMTVRVEDPVATAAKWATVLDRSVVDDTIELDDATVRFLPNDDPTKRGITGIEFATSKGEGGRADVECLGTTLTFTG